jgi:DNA repair photolyase
MLGFNEEHVVLRLDPILPNKVGLKIAESVLSKFNDTGIKRVRLSSLDMYNHVKERIKSMGFNPPYESFHAPKEMTDNLDSLLSRYSNRYEFESCAEIGRLSIPKTVGCVSQRDIDIIKPEFDVSLVGSSRQRTSCLCPSNKVQIIRTKPRRCHNKCIYCYWRD